MLLMCWWCWCADAMTMTLLMRWCAEALMHWCCWCADAADALMLCWCCWCIDAADVLMLLMRWCCWCADALMLLMRWCCWCCWCADALIRWCCWCADATESGSARRPFFSILLLLQIWYSSKITIQICLGVVRKTHKSMCLRKNTMCRNMFWRHKCTLHHI